MAPRVALLRRAGAPTDDIYALAPLTRLAQAGHVALDAPDMSLRDLAYRLGLGDRLAGRQVILSRYCPAAVLERIGRVRPTLCGLHYIVDDDVPAAADSPALPEDYRKRQMRVAEREFPRLRDLADQFVVTSSWLFERYRSPRTVLLDPVLIWHPPPLEHFDAEEIVVAFHATAIHQADLAAITPALIAVHEARPRVRIELVTSGHVDPALLRLPRVVRKRSMSWRGYRRFMQRARRHVLVVPLMDTPFNRGKSHVKVLDAAGLGAAGVYSARSPYADVVAHGRSGLLVGDDVAEWRDAILALVDDPGGAREVALQGQQLARRIGDPDRAVAFWRRAFGLQDPGAPASLIG